MVQQRRVVPRKRIGAARPRHGDAERAATRAVNLTVGDITDSGLMYLAPFIYGLSKNYDPTRLFIGIVIQAFLIVFFTLVLYYPLFPEDYWTKWDVVHRISAENAEDEKKKKKRDGVVESKEEKDEPKDEDPASNVEDRSGWTRWRWIRVLAMRHGSSFHLLLSLTTDKLELVLPLVAAASYIKLYMDQTGIRDLSALLSSAKEKVDADLAAAKVGGSAGSGKSKSVAFEDGIPSAPDEMGENEKMFREAVKTMDASAAVGAPVLAAGFMIWWLGTGGMNMTREVFGW